MTGKIFSYPHPVLGNGDDILSGSALPEFNYAITDEAIRLNGSNLVTGHADIDAMLSTGAANWQIRVSCARTYMRVNFVTPGPEWTTTLDGADFEGTVKIDAQVIATKALKDYMPANAHEDYGAQGFDLKSGELIATGPSFTFLVDKDYDPLKAPVASLLQVRQGEHQTGPFQLVLDDDRLVVNLSKTDWQEYAGIKDRVPELLHSAIVLPAIASAIASIDKNEGTLWAGRLKDLLGARQISRDNPLEAAQQILSNPLTRTFSRVNAKLDGTGA